VITRPFSSNSGKASWEGGAAIPCSQGEITKLPEQGRLRFHVSFRACVHDRAVYLPKEWTPADPESSGTHIVPADADFGDHTKACDENDPHAAISRVCNQSSGLTGNTVYCVGTSSSNSSGRAKAPCLRSAAPHVSDPGASDHPSPVRLQILRPTRALIRLEALSA